MRIEHVKYVDYDGNQREEDHYFNISRAELLELEMSVGGGLDAKIKRLGQTLEGPEVMKLFKDIISLAYGIKTLDGKRIEKSEKITKEFMETEAYSEILMRLLQDPDYAAAFIKDIIPKNIEQKENVTELHPVN